MTNEWRWGMSWLVLMNDHEGQIMWNVWQLLYANSYVCAMRCICCVVDFYVMHVMQMNSVAFLWETESWQWHSLMHLVLMYLTDESIKSRLTKTLHQDTFTHRNFYTEGRLYTYTFTHRSFYTEEICTHKLLHRRAFTSRHNLHIWAFTTKSVTHGSF